MKRALFLILFSFLVSSCATSTVTQPVPLADTVSLDDIVLLASSEISDQTIFTFLDYRILDFALDAKSMQQLRESGVSEAVILYLLEMEPSLILPTISDAATISYGSSVYPRYYYGSRGFNNAFYPNSFYDHNYFGLGYTAISGFGLHNSVGNSFGYRSGISGNHGGNVSHTPNSVYGGYRGNLGANINHRIADRSSGVRHVGGGRIGSNLHVGGSRSGGHRSSGGHSGGGGGHSGGGGHGGGH